jgi:hypothetical protein
VESVRQECSVLEQSLGDLLSPQANRDDIKIRSLLSRVLFCRQDLYIL